MTTIAIIGNGSLGGFLALSLSELEEVDNLILIDDDKVESKNLKNSVFREVDVGRSKTSALRDIIYMHDNNTYVQAIETKFIEGESVLPDLDLAIDCRDYIYDRKDVIDCRMYMSGRYLIIDCRKDISYATNHQGKYLNKLTKDDLRLAAFNASMFIHKGLLNDLNEMVHKIELDYMNRDVSNALQLRKDKTDLLVDSVPGDRKILNLQENINPIIELNKDADITVYLGDRKLPLIEKEVYKQTLISPDDVIRCLTSFIEVPHSFNNYLISVGRDGLSCFIELLAETGAA